jgi:hypothetical protein
VKAVLVPVVPVEAALVDHPRMIPPEVAALRLTLQKPLDCTHAKPADGAVKVMLEKLVTVEAVRLAL